MSIDEEKLIGLYPELHHYTGWEALKGIVSLNTFWATHYKYLNDLTEVVHMKAYLASLVPRNRPERRSAVKKIQELYDKTFTKFVTPYIVSFTTHSAGSDFDRENGITNQWIPSKASDGSEIGGYGRHGCALVFDARQLNDMINREFESFLYSQTTLSNVVYNQGIDGFKLSFTSLIPEASWFLWDKDAELRPGYKGLPKNYARAEEFINEFVKSAVSFKHGKWSQEQEVRIVAHPKHVSELAYIKDTDPDDIKALRNRQPKQIHHRKKDGRTIPFIKLFDGLNATLQIKRIIVAPDKDQAALYEQVKRLVADTIPVHRSELELDR
jgi:hypothetical protein